MKTYNFYELCCFMETSGDNVKYLLRESGIYSGRTPSEWAVETKRVVLEGDDIMFTSRAINSLKETAYWQSIVDTDEVGNCKSTSFGKYKPSTQKRKGVMS